MEDADVRRTIVSCQIYKLPPAFHYTYPCFFFFAETPMRAHLQVLSSAAERATQGAQYLSHFSHEGELKM